MVGKPLRDITVEELWEIATNCKSTQELVDAYVCAHNKFWIIEDEIYDYEEGTEKYKQTDLKIDSWEKIYDYLEGKVVACAKEEGMLASKQNNSGLVRQLKAFMEKYGYRDGSGWWIRKDKCNEN